VSSNLTAPTIQFSLKTLVKTTLAPILKAAALRALQNIPKTFRADSTLKVSET
jgi:hypothetical protein